MKIGPFGDARHLMTTVRGSDLNLEDVRTSMAAVLIGCGTHLWKSARVALEKLKGAISIVVLCCRLDTGNEGVASMFNAKGHRWMMEEWSLEMNYILYRWVPSAGYSTVTFLTQ